MLICYLRFFTKNTLGKNAWLQINKGCSTKNQFCDLKEDGYKIENAPASKTS